MLTARIRIQPAEGDWVARAGGAVIGESNKALELQRENLAPVIYFPREDVAMAFLELSDTQLRSEDQGTARYFNIVLRSRTIPDAAWTIEKPMPEVDRIAGYIAFHPSFVTLEQVN